MLVNQRCLSREFAARLLTWRHSGFQVYRAESVGPDDRPALERLCAYIGRAVFASSRVEYDPSSGAIHYRTAKGAQLSLDALEWIALVTVILTAMSIVREKEIGTMEQLMVTPIRPIELMVGKLLPFGLIGIVEVAVVTIAALLVFRIPFRGSVLVLFGATLVFLLTTLGIGLFVSTISHTQQQAVVSSFFFFLPAFMLNGFAFPIRNMPAPVQVLTYFNPLR